MNILTLVRQDYRFITDTIRREKYERYYEGTTNWLCSRKWNRHLEHMSGLDRVFMEKVSGKDVFRPELDALLKCAREGDTVVVHSMDRLARNLDDLRKLVQSLTERRVRVDFIKENITFTGKNSPMATLILDHSSDLEFTQFIYVKFRLFTFSFKKYIIDFINHSVIIYP